LCGMFVLLGDVYVDLRLPSRRSDRTESQ
jgi:hypothetical protein